MTEDGKSYNSRRKRKRALSEGVGSMGMPEAPGGSRAPSLWKARKRKPLVALRYEQNFGHQNEACNYFNDTEIALSKLLLSIFDIFPL